MRVALSQPAFQWATERSAKIKGQQNHKVKILFPSLEISDSGSSTTTILDLPCSFEIPSDPTDLSRFLDDEAVFEVFLGNEKQHVYTTTVRECIPIFQTRKIEWTHQEITVSINSKVELSIRPILGQMMKYKNQSYTIANQLVVNRNMILVAATPIITTLATSAVATAPVWLPLTLIVGIVGFPIWIIVGAVVSTMVTCSLCIAGLTVVVVRSKMFQDGFQDLCLSPSGQFLLYQEVNPNVEPSKFAHLSHQLREYIMADPSRKLMASLAIDFVGNISFALPGLGEFADVFWAPISATLLSHLYSTSVPMAQYAGLVEEILPFTDIIPTATLAWLKENASQLDVLQQELGKILQAAKLNPKKNK